MNTKHRHGSVVRTEVLDIVRGSTACSPMVFYGLLAWANLPARNPSRYNTKAELDAMTSSPVALRPTWKGNLCCLLVVAVIVIAVAS